MPRRTLAEAFLPTPVIPANPPCPGRFRRTCPQLPARRSRRIGEGVTASPLHSRAHPGHVAPIFEPQGLGLSPLVPSPPSARSLERRRERAARFPRTGSVLQTGYIPLHFAALPTLPRNNPEITSLPVCANAAQTGMTGRPRPRFAHEARRSRRYGVSRRTGVFAPCGSGPDQPKPHVQLRLWLRSMRERSRLCRRRFFAPSGTERAVRLPCRGECPGKGRIQKKTASSGVAGEPSPQAFGPVRRRGPSRP